MKHALCAILAGMAITLCSCTSFLEDKPGESMERQDERARLQLRKAHHEVESQRYYYARELVKPLLEHATVGREAKLLLREIDFQIQYRAVNREQSLSGKIALNDVEKRMVLPETYNKTTRFIAKTGPFILEKGPMEEMLHKKVSMEVEDATLEALLQQLRAIDGMQFIADQELEVERQLTVKVKDVPLRDLLSYIERNMGLQFYVTKNVIWISQGEANDEVKPQLEMKIIHLRKGYIPGKTTANNRGGRAGNQGGGGDEGGGAGEDDLYDVLTAFMEEDPTPGSKFEIYRNRNILIVKDTREKIRFMQELIDAFDRDYMQVMIEAKFITIKQNDLEALGTQINSLSKQNRLLTDGDDTTNPTSDGLHSFISQTLMHAPTATTGATAAFGGILDGFIYDITLSLLNQFDTTKTLAAPRITVLNNHEASISQGSTKYFFTEFESDSTTTSTNNGITTSSSGLVPVGTPEEFEDGLDLKIRPSIGNDGRSIILNIDLSDNTITGVFTGVTGSSDTTGNPGNANNTDTSTTSVRLPEVSRREIKTVVTLNSGQTVVMGGVMRHTVEEKESKVPFLGDIPLLGWLFKTVEEVRTPEHLLVFITANIVDLDGRFRVAEEREAAARDAASVLRKSGMNPTDVLDPSIKPNEKKLDAKKILKEHGIDANGLLKEDDKATPKVKKP